MAGISVEGIDHVHVRVTNRETAAAWFGHVLGLQIDTEFSSWANDPRGPLFLSTRNGTHCLALFEDRNVKKTKRGDYTIAFRVSVREFIDLLDRLDDLQLTKADGSKLSRNDVVDHELSWSIYFIDPDGNRFELTSYYYNEISSLMIPI